MNNKQIKRHIEEYKRIRQEWLDILVADPRHTTALQMMLSVNSKIELLETLWNWHDTSVEFPSR